MATTDRTNRDSALLRRYLETPNSSCFEKLVRRHAAMVSQVCRRIIQDEHLAEDATQDVFILLARKAKRIRQPELLGNWLYGVAVRKSLEVRRSRKVISAPLLETDIAIEHGDGAAELAMVVDEELSQLPEKYRVPLVMHYFSGYTVKRIARATEVPSGTLSSRLQRGRELLRSRLVKRGLKAGAMLVVLLFNADGAEASEGLIKTLARRAVVAKRKHRSPLRTLVPMLIASSISFTAVSYGAVVVVDAVGEIPAESTDTEHGQLDSTSDDYGIMSLFRVRPTRCRL